MNHRRYLPLFLILFCADVGFAAGPLLTDPFIDPNTGLYVRRPTRWVTDTVQYEVDPKGLGPNLNAQQSLEFVAETLALWKTNTARIVGEVSGQLAEPVTIDNYLDFIPSTSETPARGSNNIIFDNDGAIINDLQGAGSSTNILGLSFTRTNNTGDIISGVNIINGTMLNGDPPPFTLEDVRTTILHEFGHFFGLDHSQINFYLNNNGNVFDDKYVPIMIPFSGDGVAEAVRTRFDDKMSLTLNYPIQTVGTPTVAGQILAGTKPVLGANIVLRRVDARSEYITSLVSDYLYNQDGVFLFQNLPSGEFEYEIFTEPVNERFIGASSVGPYIDFPGDPNSPTHTVATPVMAEFFDGVLSSATDLVFPEYFERTGAVDDRNSATRFTLSESQQIDTTLVTFQVTTQPPPSNEDSAQIIALEVPELGGIGGLPEGVTDAMLFSGQPFMVESMPSDLALRVELIADPGTPLELVVLNEQRLLEDFGGNPFIYTSIVRGVSIPGFVPHARTDGTGVAVVRLATDTVPALETGTYFISVGNPNIVPASYYVRVTKNLDVPFGVPRFLESALAALNRDVTSDDFAGQFGDLQIVTPGPVGADPQYITSGFIGPATAVPEGNLVGELPGRLFHEASWPKINQLIPDITTTPGEERVPYTKPLYDPTKVGSLIRFNMEPGDDLMLAAVVTNVTPDDVAALYAAEPGSVSHTELVERLTKMVHAQWTAPAAVGLVTAVTGEPVYPTDVYVPHEGVISGVTDETHPLPSPYIAVATETVVFIWDGRELGWQVGQNVFSTSVALENLVVISSERAPEFRMVPNSIGVDILGPEKRVASDGGDLVPQVYDAIRFIDRTAYVHLPIVRDGTSNDFTTEFIAGDIVVVTSAFNTRAELDGEEQFEGDRVTLTNANYNFANVGGFVFNTNGGVNPFKGEAFISQATGGFVANTTQSVAGAVHYMATGVVGESYIPQSSGDYSVMPLVFSVFDDVVDPLVQYRTIRIDTVPARVVSVSAQTEIGLIPNATGELEVVPGEIVVVTAEIDLGGDPFTPQDRPTLTADFSAFNAKATAVPAMDYFVVSATAAHAMAVFAVETEASVRLNLNGAVIFTVTDDAGNVTRASSRDFGLIFQILGRTGFDMAEGDALAAGLNEDATDDRIALQGPFGSAERRHAGDLIALVSGGLHFTDIVDATSAGNTQPIYDPELPGSLLDANLEVGDMLVFSATVTHVTESLVTQLISSPVESEAFRAALAEVTRQVVMVLDRGTRIRLADTIDPASAFYPTSATGLPAGAIDRATGLILNWNGAKYSPPLILAASTQTTDPVSIASFYPTDVTTAFDVKSTSVGVDVDGPNWTEGADEEFIRLVSAVRPANPLIGTTTRTLYSQSIGTPDIEFIPSDILTLNADLNLQAYKSGESSLPAGATGSIGTTILGHLRPGGDSLRFSDILADISALGGTPTGSDETAVERAFYEYNDELLDVSDLLLDEPVTYQVETVLGQVRTIGTSGDYQISPVTFTVADEVNPATFAILPSLLRYDDRPLTVANVTFNPSNNDPIVELGRTKYRVFPGDSIEIVVTIDLNGDPFEAGVVPQVTADLSNFDPARAAEPPLSISDNGDGTANVVFSVTVTEDAPTTARGEVVFLLVDDAGNASRVRSSELGYSVAIRYGVPVVALGTAAAINRDATSDNLGRFGANGSPEALAAGNLVGSTYAILFVTPTVDPGADNRTPLYDPSLPGSLINANAERDEALLVGAEIRNITPALVTALSVATPGTPEYEAAADDIRQLINLQLIPDAFAGSNALDPNELIPPHAVLPVAYTVYPATESVLVVWDGRDADIPWDIGNQPISTTEPVLTANLLHQDSGEVVAIPVGTIGIDRHGPAWVQVVGTRYRAGAVPEFMTAGTTNFNTPPTILAELIAGDELRVVSILNTRAEEDGEAAENGDPLDPATDMHIDLTSVGGPLTAGKFTGTLNSAGMAIGQGVLGATATVGELAPLPVTSGDYELFPVVLSATDDVLPAVTETLYVRLDTVPVGIMAMTASTEDGRLPDAGGSLTVSPFEIVVVTATIDLAGDPFDVESAPIVTLDADQLSPDAVGLLPIAFTESSPGIAQAVFEVPVSELVRANDAAQVTLYAVDDAGNPSSAASSDLGLTFNVLGRTGFTIAPGDVIIAGLNVDATSDLLERLGPAGSDELRENGDLVAMPTAALFQRVVDNPATGNLEPLYDPTLLGSLLDANLEVGDTLVLAVRVSYVSPDVVTTIRSASVTSPEYAAAVESVTQGLAAMFDTTLGIEMGLLDTTELVRPTDVTGTVSTYPASATSVLVVWDGHRTEPALTITGGALAVDPVRIARVLPTDTPFDFSQLSTPLGLDVEGPEWTVAAGETKPVKLLSAIRQADGIFFTEDRELASGDAVTDATLQLSPSDVLLVSGYVRVNADRDGESAAVGDALTLADAAADFTAIGGPDGLTVGNNERFVVVTTDEVFDPAVLPLTADEAGYLVTATVGPVAMDRLDFVPSDVVLSVTDDVTEPKISRLTLLYDSRPIEVTGFSIASTRNATAVIDGVTRLEVLTDEIVTVTVTLDLAGDSFIPGEIPKTVMELSAFDPFASRVAPLSLTELTPGIVQAVFVVTVKPEAVTNPVAEIRSYYLDDAGNLTLSRSSDFGVLVSVVGGIPGDFNGDGVVDFHDLFIFSGFWQQASTTPGLSPLDLIRDANELINKRDLLRLIDILK